MAKFTKCLAMCLLLAAAAFVGGFGVEEPITEAGKTASASEETKMVDARLTEIAKKMLIRKFQAGLGTSDTTQNMFLKEMQLIKGNHCVDTCFAVDCTDKSCICQYPFCVKNELPPELA